MPGGTVEVIEADLADPAQGEAIYLLLDTLARAPASAAGPLPAGFRHRLPEALARRPFIRTLLARVDGGWVGCAVLLEGFSTFTCRPKLNIHDLVVAAGHRRQGIGTALLERTEAIARALGCAYVTLEVSTANPQAQALYRRRGFVDSGFDPQGSQTWHWAKALD